MVTMLGTVDALLTGSQLLMTGVTDGGFCLVQSWGSAVWNTVTAPVSYLSSGIRRLSGHVER